jgi:hypothetical protein
MGIVRLHHLSLAALAVGLLLAGSLRAESPTPAPADEALIVAWPAAEDPPSEMFEGGHFYALHTPANAGEGPFTISVWVNASDLANGDPNYGRGIARSTRGEKVGDWILNVRRDGKVHFYNWRTAGDDKSGSHLTNDSLIKADAWQHVATTWDGTATRIFVDGVEAQHTPGSTASGWGEGHEVGRGWTDPGYHWSGEIANFRVLKKALSLEDLQVVFKAGPPAAAAETEAPPTGDPAVSAALDGEILAKLATKQLTPAPPADDAEFLRRITLDLAGRIPTVSELDAFLADTSPDKRARRIDALLASREMAGYWSQVLSNWLMPVSSRRDEKFVGYLRTGLRKNKPWNQFVREMLVSAESPGMAGNAKQFLVSRRGGLNDKSIARDIGQALLGANLRCAQCHDHPHVPAWTHEKYLGLVAFFARSFEHNYTVGGQQMLAIGERNAGELEHAGKGGEKRTVVPTFLDGKSPAEPAEKAADPEKLANDAPPPAPAFSRRDALATVALDPASPYLKRAMVNRVWQRLMGRGLVEPVDMLHDDNPPTHPALLDLLADDFANHGYDLRRLIAVIMHSEAYARSSRWTSGDLPAEQLYAVAVPRPLDADQLALSLPIALSPSAAGEGQPARGPIGLKPWLELRAEFDGPASSFEPTAQQALFLLNSEALLNRLAEQSPLPGELTALSDEAAAARAYAVILSRTATADETRQFTAYLAERGPDNRPAACRELVWALLTGSEFRFNH